MKALKWLAWLVSDLLSFVLTMGITTAFIVYLYKINIHQLTDHIWIITKG